ncbi:uncharacterized protein LOC117149467 [Drosophila mauritiana]|uniref:Uncharacterized protein LOC117149467 n=1 Tax=Drosophila mauritiana TaxID=7226 RepID=A0A6P8KR59_DROMA|nr:uncharacterized protein LOC117149467 [Drosophila mauritiana]
MEDQLRILMEHQNQSFLELAKTLQASVREPAQNGVVTLPKFNADIPGADATQWCSTVDIIVAEKPLEGSALILALTKSLEGSASQWLSEVCYAGVTWLEFKQLFQQRYANAETPAAMFLQLLNSRPGNSECLAIYASRMVTSLVCKWKGLDTEKRAELCVVDEPKTSMLLRGENFPIIFDSGAECSLIKESFAKNISGKIINNVVSLKGIGNANVCSTIQIDNNILINGNSLNVIFHVVPDDCMSNNIVLGREVLAQGYAAVVSCKGVEIIKNETKTVNSCSKFIENSFEIIENNVCGENKNEITTLLKSYSDSFIQGTPQTRVNSGEMKIRLIDETKTVQRRSYRLSPS